jgi:lactate 2-monooxygenase
LRSYTDLPIVLKGIQTVSDAQTAMDKGINALYISNHGGRQVDGACASLDQLYLIRQAVGEDYPLLFDSGVRSGADAMKALCLGATAVGIGRPYVYALALKGEKGVRQMLRYYRAELEQNMFLSGCTSVSDLSPEILRSFQSQ